MLYTEYGEICPSKVFERYSELSLRGLLPLKRLRTGIFRHIQSITFLLHISALKIGISEIEQTAVAEMMYSLTLNIRNSNQTSPL